MSSLENQFQQCVAGFVERLFPRRPGSEFHSKRFRSTAERVLPQNAHLMAAEAQLKNRTRALEFRYWSKSRRLGVMTMLMAF